MRLRTSSLLKIGSPLSSTVTFGVAAPGVSLFSCGMSFPFLMRLGLLGRRQRGFGLVLRLVLLVR